MLVDQVFSAHLVLPDSSYQDITGGILNVDISHGTEVYEGPYQQIDTGLFTIVSRSSTLDPNVNVNVTEGAAIEFRDSRNVEAGKVILEDGVVIICNVYKRRQKIGNAICIKCTSPLCAIAFPIFCLLL